MPVDIFILYGSKITLNEGVSRQRKPKSHVYREAWDLIEKHIAGW